MGLITCYSCGKKISDTSKNCIHCGASVKPKKIIETNFELEKSSNTKSSTEEHNKNPEYYSLSKSEQEALEMEFVSNDAVAFKFRRKELEFKKFLSLSESFFLIAILLFVISRYVATQFFNSKASNENLVAVAVILMAIQIIIGIIYFIKYIVSKIIYKRSIKKYIYLKKFEVWLKDNEKINYIPLFLNNSEKRIYEQIDLEKMKL